MGSIHEKIGYRENRRPGIITCVSGAVQFTACMNTSECIIAINNDKNAPIFQAAHYGHRDLYEILLLCDEIRKRK